MSDSVDDPPGLSREELSKKQETHRPRNKCLGQPVTPVTPSCCLSAHGFLATLIPHCSLCNRTCLLGLSSTFLGPRSPLSHTPGLCLLWQLLCLPSELSGTTSQTQRSLARENSVPDSVLAPLGQVMASKSRRQAQKKAAPCTGLLLQVLTTQRKRTQGSAHCWAGIPTPETALAGSPGNQSLSWREVGKILRPYGWEPETWTSGPCVSL